MSFTNVDVRLARHLIALGKHLSFTRAADDLGLTQSALSRSIQQLEDLAKVRLFDRSRDGVHPTAAGKAVIRQAEVMIRESAEMGRILSRASVDGEDEVVFGIGRLPAPTFLPIVLPEALRIKPRLHCRVLTQPPDELLALLVAEQIEFLVCAGRIVKGINSLQSVQLGTFESVQIVRRGHPLLTDNDIAHYNDFPWIRSNWVSERFVSRSDHDHVGQHPQIVLDDILSASQIAANSNMIWLTSSFTAAGVLAEGNLEKLPWAGATRRAPIGLMFYSLRGRSLSPAATLMLDLFRQAATALEGG